MRPLLPSITDDDSHSCFKSTGKFAGVQNKVLDLRRRNGQTETSRETALLTGDFAGERGGDETCLFKVQKLINAQLFKSH